MEFTKEIKSNWLKALKSGEFTQGQKIFKDASTHCCLGVLNDTLPMSKRNVWAFKFNKTPLIEANDKECKNFKPDYSNVIPLIEKLETVD